MAWSGLEKAAVVLFVVWLFLAGKFVFGVIYTYVIGPAINKVDFKSKGRWALITGSTDGIGKAYAKALASRGCDIVLVSRTLDKLKAVAEEIEKEYSVQTRVIQADFTGGDDVYDNIAQQAAGLEIGTLVNNVGMSYEHPEYFLDVSLEDKQKIMAANMAAVTRMCSMLMPEMVRRGRGVVINVGSASSCIPSPLLTVYAASKAYVDKLSEGLDMEYGKKGIIVQCVMPGFVVSNMSKLRSSTFLAPTPAAYVASALAAVGTASRTTGYFPHALFVGTINCIQAVSSGFGTWLVTRSLENTRLRALKKYKKQ